MNNIVTGAVHQKNVFFSYLILFYDNTMGSPYSSVVKETLLLLPPLTNIFEWAVYAKLGGANPIRPYHNYFSTKKKIRFFF
jgi:hypothetical protein